MIGFIFAMESEITAVKDINKDIKVYQTDFFKYYLFSQNNQDFVFVFSGIGKANAAAATLEIIKTFSLKKIINIGICGTNKNHLKSNDILILSRNYYLDVDATFFDYEYGQIPKEKPYFENNNELTNSIKSIFDELKIDFIECYGATADSFININNYNQYNKNLFDLVSCLDMEATAIKQIASKTNVQTCFIKIISDNVLVPKNGYEESKKNWPLIVTKIIGILTDKIKE
ncbi:MAG: 5'-methylthioadenosine/S-adenosylhomocysteine nucleosidase [Malacoplasma sp.]|nr:5'-methylthioadenosine/S-adenosylhomocysteine nucleosidase [Malacoplasma sp.]MDE7075667.1 5'-methylthioadenosine/S-adenosylhomocysteine nucleosidase [Malacoplasma sp.]